MSTFPSPTIFQISAISFKISPVGVPSTREQSNLPSRMSMAVSVSTSYPKRSKSAPWHTGALFARSNLGFISSPMTFWHASLVSHFLIVPSRCLTST